MLEVKAFQTPIFQLGEDLLQFILQNVGSEIKEGDVLAITSKIVSLWKKRIVPKNQTTKEKLIFKEADVYLGPTEYNGHLTIKENQLFASAGIDESNCSGEFWILFPQDPYKVANEISQFLKNKLSIKNLGVLLTDSKTTPLRRGVTGTALSYAGFNGIENKVDEPDLFNRPLKMTQINIADALATSAVFVMGEGNESRPLAIIRTTVCFSDSTSASEIQIPVKEDLYSPLFKDHL